MSSVEAERERYKAFMAGSDTPGPVVMINLLRYRQQAEYPAGFDAEPCSGREAYKRYSAAAFPMIQESGGRVVYWGEVQASVIAPAGEEWDDAFLVEYPNRQAMLSAVGAPEYRAIVPHRTAALSDSRLIATRQRDSTEK